MPRKPTPKQKKAFNLLVENSGEPLRGVLTKAGYSEPMADNPDRVLESAGFLQLIEEHLPDWKLAQVHSEGLTAVKTTRDKFGDKYEDPDYYARHQYLETAYKIKGRLNPPNSDKTGDVNITLAIYGNEEHKHTISIPATTIPNAVSQGDGRRIQQSGDSVASQERQGQDSTASGD